jgi:DNA-binding beta-propeller fold protein YncE
MKTKRFIFTLCALAGLGAATSACSLGDSPGDDQPPAPDAGPPPPDARVVAPPPPVPPPAEYKRASLRPLYQLTPTSEFGRFTIFDQQMLSADFQSANRAASVAARMGQIGNQITLERGETPGDPGTDLFIDGENETRATLIPFRGNPTDVKFMEFEGQRKAFVPLGGDVTTVGNEVAVVDLDNGQVLRRVTVGIHPQRVFAHAPSGLVFVCNQFSNYISIIDARTDDLLQNGGEDVEIPTDFYCTDLLAIERANFGEDDELHLYVANEFRASVMRYAINIVRDINNNVQTVEVLAPAGEEHIPEMEITGVGRNPLRLNINEDTEAEIYVTNGRGGEQATVRIPDGELVRKIAFKAPSVDAVAIRDKLFIPTLTPFRGYPSDQAQVIPDDIETDPITVRGPNGEDLQVHPGAADDGTDSYNFEDLRSGVFEIDTDLSGKEVYMTDDNDADDNFNANQKVLAASVPYDIARNADGDKVYVVFLGNNIIQEFSVVNNGDFRLRDDGNLYATLELPMAVALDEDAGVLMAVNYGADNLQIFDLDNANLLQTIDLGYANPKYPATTIELGEYAYATSEWANDGRKACTICHWDRFLVDGIEYGNGATAATMPHQVKPNYNLLETDKYFWNGSFVNNSYASLAFAAQSRTNCELILFSLIEGVDSDPADRVGDPVNFTSQANDADCRPNTNVIDQANGLPTSLNGDVNGDGLADFNDIAEIIAAQKQIAFAQTGLALQAQLDNLGRFDAVNGQNNRDEISRAMDFYGAAELRLPPNPLNQMRQLNMVDPVIEDKIKKGEEIFRNKAGCANCHNPDNSNAPFTDDRDHGRGAEFFTDFIREYGADARLLGIPGLEAGIPQAMQDAATSETTPAEINWHDDDQDGFQPFAFDQNLMLRFDNPRASNGDEETRRLVRLALINLADPDREHIPGNVIGQPRVNTPSLRGVWLQYNLLRHGLALNLREAVLAPGHPVLREGEKGFAIDRIQGMENANVHGVTEDLNESEMEQLEYYVRSIE